MYMFITLPHMFKHLLIPPLCTRKLDVRFMRRHLLANTTLSCTFVLAGLLVKRIDRFLQ